jgi:tRNA G18 (ribose-2'-O)-methylase SpoU
VEPECIDDAADPRLADYVGLSDPDLRRRVETDGGFFIAEGPLVVRTLLSTTHKVRSVVVTPAQRDALADVLPGVGAPIYVVSPEIMRKTVGFDLHRGAVAAADRRPLPPVDAVTRNARRLAVLERVNDHENLGVLFRNAAAFAIDGMLLCPQTSDPLYRRSVRVSIGHVLTVPWTRAEPWPDALDRLRVDGFRVVALTPALDAEPIDDLAVRSDERIAFLLGAEGPGLSAAALARSDLHARIPIAPGVDSLNVAVAAAIAFHRFAPLL